MCFLQTKLKFFWQRTALVSNLVDKVGVNDILFIWKIFILYELERQKKNKLQTFSITVILFDII